MRKHLQWFEFGGVRSSDMGAYLTDMPKSAAPAPRLTAHAVSGRDGCLYISDNTLSEFDIIRTLRVPAERLRGVKSWLRGAGSLRFSSEPDALFDAHIAKIVEFRQILPGEDGLWEGSVTFSCQPHPFLYPAAQQSAFTAPGELPTPQGMTGLPRITIEGGGAFTLTIGADTLSFTGVEGGIIVDSALGDALTLDGAQLANDKFTGPLPRLTSSLNMVSWQAGNADEAGYVDRVTILPRWRYV